MVEHRNGKKSLKPLLAGLFRGYKKWANNKNEDKRKQFFEKINTFCDAFIKELNLHTNERIISSGYVYSGDNERLTQWTDTAIADFLDEMTNGMESCVVCKCIDTIVHTLRTPANVGLSFALLPELLKSVRYSEHVDLECLGMLFHIVIVLVFFVVLLYLFVLFCCFFVFVTSRH